jgi:hypothetical protein
MRSMSAGFRGQAWGVKGLLMTRRAAGAAARDLIALAMTPPRSHANCFENSSQAAGSLLGHLQDVLPLKVLEGVGLCCRRRQQVPIEHLLLARWAPAAAIKHGSLLAGRSGRGRCNMLPPAQPPSCSQSSISSG